VSIFRYLANSESILPALILCGWGMVLLLADLVAPKERAAWIGWLSMVGLAGALVAEVILGFLTFTGSLMAAGKLMEIIPTRPIVYNGQNAINLSLIVIAVLAALLLSACDSRCPPGSMCYSENGHTTQFRP